MPASSLAASPKPSRRTIAVDRPSWAEAVTVSAFGLRVGLRASRPGLLDHVLALLPPGARRAASARVDRLYSLVAAAAGDALTVYANGVPLVRSAEPGPALSVLAMDLEDSLAALAPRRVFVHAGVVGWRGRAILLPGRSLSGKTTLTAALVRAGALYYSDEFAVLDEAGLVHPYARPLAIRREGSCEPGAPCAVAALGGRSGRRPLPVGLVVLSRFRRDAVWRPRRLSPGAGALALLANTVAARRVAERALPILGLVATRAPVLEGARGEARGLVDSLLEQVAGASPPSTPERSCAQLR